MSNASLSGILEVLYQFRSSCHIYSPDLHGLTTKQKISVSVCLFSSTQFSTEANQIYSGCQLNVKPHVSFALAECVCPPSCLNRFPKDLARSGPITMVYLISGGFDTKRLHRVVLFKLVAQCDVTCFMAQIVGLSSYITRHFGI